MGRVSSSVPSGNLMMAFSHALCPWSLMTALWEGVSLSILRMRKFDPLMSCDTESTPLRNMTSRVSSWILCLQNLCRVKRCGSGTKIAEEAACLSIIFRRWLPHLTSHWESRGLLAVTEVAFFFKTLFFLPLAPNNLHLHL